MSLQEIEQIAIGAGSAGGILALVGIGFATLFKTTGVLSIAQGDFMVIGAFIYSSLASASGVAPGIIMACVIVAVLAGGSYVVVFRRLVGAPAFMASIATIAYGSLILAITILIYGPDIIVLKIGASLNSKVKLSQHVVVNGVELVIFALAVVIGIGLEVVIRRTKVGLQMRAVADDNFAASYLGVSVHRVSAYAWALSGAAASVAGILYSMLNQLNPGTLPQIGLVAFPAVLIGGLDSVVGALIGGLAVGVIEQVTTVLIGARDEVGAAYVLMLAIMFVIPTGLFGGTTVRRL